MLSLFLTYNSQSRLSVYGAIAKRLCRGLQSRLDQFDSGSRLHIFKNKAKSEERRVGKECRL